MEEILFRGKLVKNGEWAHGSLFVDDKKEKHEILVGYTNYRIAWEVEPFTVGQFTGLTDKNGKRIFEGDIVRYMNNDIMVVVWNKESASFACAYSYINFNYCATLINGHMYLEVIGNIHDNPELLEG